MSTRESLWWIAPAAVIAGLLVIVILESGILVKQSAILQSVTADRDRLFGELDVTKALVSHLIEQRDACLSKPETVCPPPLPKPSRRVPETPLFDSEARRILGF